jgi:diguanylate cyclase
MKLNKITPLELAKQTFLQLSKEQIQPTPENYKRVYDELAGVESHDHFDHVNWSTLLSFVLKQLEANHPELSVNKKKELLHRAINNAKNDQTKLALSIQSLVTSWGEGQTTIDFSGIDPPEKSDVVKPTFISTATQQHQSLYVDEASNQLELAVAWREMLIKVIHLTLLPQFADNPSFVGYVDDLMKQAQGANSIEEVTTIREDLKSILLRSEMELDTLHGKQASLIEMLRLLVSSMREMATDENWLLGQMTIIQDVISNPLDIDVLYNAQSSLKALIEQQSKIKPTMHAAKVTIKEMMKIFLTGITDVTNNTGIYEDKINTYQQQVADTEDMFKLNAILQNLSVDISSMSIYAKRSHETFFESQKKVEAAENKINELTAQLDSISEAAHQDFLTGALNRRGMDQIIQREFYRADRHHSPISLAMLDIDHFKKINDTMGHTTGDVALAHLAKVVKSVIRSTDVLVRYGGEEFLILLPGSKQNDAVNVVTGIQRKLTKNFFMYDDNRVLITFSAGVAERMIGENIESILPRADAALYIAKQTGRNRVVGAEVIQE